jgi:hypothetical protein
MKELGKIDTLPLTWAQEAYWVGFHAARAFRDDWVVLHDRWRLPLNTSLARLQNVIGELVAQTDMLRTSFSDAMEPPAQYVHAAIEPGITLCDEAEFTSQFEAARGQSFDIVAELPYSIVVGHVREHATVIGIVAHHIVVDWAGLQAIRHRITLLLEDTPLPPTVSTQAIVDAEAKN